MDERFEPPGEEHMREREKFAELSEADQAEEISRMHDTAWFENVTTFYEDERIIEDPEAKERLRLAGQIAQRVKSEGGLALVVGGYVRDKVLREKFGHAAMPKDIDVEVYGIAFERLKALLDQIGRVDTVGAQFSVMKIGGVDVSIPRKDSKIGERHKDFVVDGDPFMSMQEAARRRDFTINALGLDPLTGEVVDHWGGIRDLQSGTLRVIDAELFKDDALRVLRAAQFSGRFGFSVHEETAALCRSMDLAHLPRERLFEEYVKLFLKSPRPSIGLEAARDLGIVEKLHPELAALFDVPQDSQWHPEGDVWMHTKMVVDAAAERAQGRNLSKESALTLMLAAVCHDMGKPATTATNDKGRITSHGHSEAGIEPADRFLDGIGVPQAHRTKIQKLVQEHLFPSVNKDAGPSAIKKLAHRLHPATIQELVDVGWADHKGRGTSWDGYPEGDMLLKKAEELAIAESKPAPLLQGRDLIALGMTPSKQFGVVLRQVYELQLEDVIHTPEEARRWVLEKIAEK